MNWDRCSYFTRIFEKKIYFKMTSKNWYVWYSSALVAGSQAERRIEFTKQWKRNLSFHLKIKFQTMNWINDWKWEYSMLHIAVYILHIKQIIFWTLCSWQIFHWPKRQTVMLFSILSVRNIYFQWHARECISEINIALCPSCAIVLFNKKNTKHWNNVQSELALQRTHKIY